jgi:type IV pilus assembly protein PilB
LAVKKDVGEMMVTTNTITIEQLEKAKKEQRATGVRLSTALVKLGYIESSQLADFLSKQYQVPAIDLTAFDIEADAVKLVPRELCERHVCIPVSKLGTTIVIAMADPSNIHARDELAFVTRCRLEIVVAPETDIFLAIERNFAQKVNYESIMTEIESSMVSGAGQDDKKVEMIDIDKDSDDGPVIKFVNLILTEAVRMRASDIHIEPYEKRFRVRFRIDGVLYDKIQPPPGIALALASRVKIMSGLNISEKRKPQDGRLKINLKGKQETDFRVSVLPTIAGEKIVMRILDKSNLQLDMTQLGFEQDELDIFQTQIQMPNGLLLITGPTGSGKTTTIYSALALLNKPDINISTAEDPVEFNLDGINQVQMNPAADLNFSTALRSFLRQDPDVIMVGEIRDLETADIAFKAALTGHLVVSTLHTNDAPQTINRLLNMGIEPFMVTSAVNLCVAQRLVRKVCKKCASPFKVEAKVLLDLGMREDELKDANLMKGTGCDVCLGTGYKGRVAVYEMLELKEAVREAIFLKATPMELKRIAIKQGMRTLRRSALNKLKAGITTIEEVVESTAPDEKIA